MNTAIPQHLGYFAFDSRRPQGERLFLSLEDHREDGTVVVTGEEPIDHLLVHAGHLTDTRVFQMVMQMHKVFNDEVVAFQHRLAEERLRQIEKLNKAV